MKGHSTDIEQPTEWGEILANHVYDKGLILRIYKEIPLKNKNREPNFKSRQMT